MTDQETSGQNNKIGETSEKNKSFWDELCGTQLATFLGIEDDSKESLKKFDDWYMDYYPYLSKHIPFNEMKGKRVLEVGLGYGTVSNKIAESGAIMTGFDIAAGPVNMLSHRLQQNDLPGEAIQGSILEAPFEDETFDIVIATGCYHHTGDLQKALDETYRILKPGGKAMVMVYYAYSYRRWLMNFSNTWAYFLKDVFNVTVSEKKSAKERAQYDANADGEAAPHTDFISARHMKRMTQKWKSTKVCRENIGDERFLVSLPRRWKNKWLGPIMGLDIYCTLIK